MRRRPVVLALIGAAFGILTTWLIVPTTPKSKVGSAPDSTTLTAGSDREASPASAPADGAARTIVVPSASAPALPSIVTGRVLLREDGSPVSNVTVVLSSDHGNNDDAEVRASVTTGADGTFRFELDGPSRLRTVRAAPGPTTTANEKGLFCHLRAGEEKRLTLHVTHGATLSGTVTDLGGAPVPRARILGWCSPNYEVRVDSVPELTAVADDAGRFTLTALGPEFTLEAAADGYACRDRLTGNLAMGQHVDGLTLKLGPAHELRGRVVDPSHRPVGGVRVDAIGTNSYSDRDNTIVANVRRLDPRDERTTTKDDGTFAFVGLADKYYLVETRHPDFPNWSANVYPNRTEIEIVLESGLAVTGTVRSTSGAPIAGAAVKVETTEGGHRTTTDTQGRFEVHGLVPWHSVIIDVVAKRYAVLVRREDGPSPPEPHIFHQPTHPENLEPENRFAAKDPEAVKRGLALDFALEPELILGGRVVDEKGEPVRDTTVKLIGDRLIELDASSGRPPTWEWHAGVDETRTDAEGRFLFPSLYAGTFTVKAEDPADPSLKAEIQASAGREDVELVFDRIKMRKVALVGTVHDAVSGAPVTEFTVIPMHRTGESDNWNGPVLAKESDDGSFTVTGLDPGQVMLMVKASGFTDWVGAPDTLDLGDHSFDVRLSPELTVAFHVTDAKMEPLRSLWLTVTEDDETARPISQRVQTDKNGDTVVHGLRVGKAIVHVQADGILTPFDFPLELTVQSSSPIALVVPLETMVQVDFLLFGTKSDVTVTDDEALRKAWTKGDIWSIDAEVAVIAKTKNGELVASGACKPDGNGGFISRSQNQGGQGPMPSLGMSVPKAIVEFEATASGYARTVVTKDLSTATEKSETIYVFLKKQ